MAAAGAGTGVHSYEKLANVHDTCHIIILIDARNCYSLNSESAASAPSAFMSGGASKGQLKWSVPPGARCPLPSAGCRQQSAVTSSRYYYVSRVERTNSVVGAPLRV